MPEFSPIPSTELAPQQDPEETLGLLQDYFSEIARDSPVTEFKSVDLNGIQYLAESDQIRFKFILRRRDPWKKPHFTCDSLIDRPSDTDLEAVEHGDWLRFRSSALEAFSATFDGFAGSEMIRVFDVDNRDARPKQSETPGQRSHPLVAFFEQLWDSVTSTGYQVARPRSVTLERVSLTGPKLGFDFRFGKRSGSAWDLDVSSTEIPNASQLQELGDRYQSYNEDLHLQLARALINARNGQDKSISVYIAPMRQPDTAAFQYTASTASAGVGSRLDRFGHPTQGLSAHQYTQTSSFGARQSATGSAPPFQLNSWMKPASYSYPAQVYVPQQTQHNPSLGSAQYAPTNAPSYQTNSRYNPSSYSYPAQGHAPQQFQQTPYFGTRQPATMSTTPNQMNIWYRQENYPYTGQPYSQMVPSATGEVPNRDQYGADISSDNAYTPDGDDGQQWQAYSSQNWR